MASDDSKIERALENGLHNYLNNLELRNAINQVPGIGNILDYILVNLGQGFQQRRLIQTMKDLREEMTQINEAMIDQSFLTTEEFCDILRKTIESCLRTRHNNKIRLYCKILAGSVILDNKDERHISPYESQYFEVSI